MIPSLRDDFDRGGFFSTVTRKLGEIEAWIRSHSAEPHGGLSYGISVFSGTFSITAAAGSWQASTLSVFLPTPGTYRLTANVRGGIDGNAGTQWWITAKLYNTTDLADVPNSERIVVHTIVAAEFLQATAAIDLPIQITSPKTITLHAKKDGAGAPTFTQSFVSSDANGRTTLMFERIGD